MLYEDPTKDRSEKNLLIAFCGNGGRLGMPIAIFLQHLNSRDWDVVVSRKGPQKRTYAAGLEGVADDFPKVVGYINSATVADQYKRVMSIGTSAGGYAAILAAVLMNGTRGVSICGFPDRSSDPSRAKLPPQVSATSRPELEFVYGADAKHDEEAAFALQRSFGGRLHPVPEVDNHNVLWELVKRGELAEFLREVLPSH